MQRRFGLVMTPAQMWRCAEIQGAGKPFVVTSRPPPAVPKQGLLIKTECAGVCHTDVHYVADEGGARTNLLGDEFAGIVLGHEICGVIQAFGEDVRSPAGLSLGDRVIVFPWIGCRQCDICRAGHSNLCETNRAATTEIGQGPETPGGYGSLVPVPHWNMVVKLPDSISPAVGCMLPCSALTTYNAVMKLKESVIRGFQIRNYSRVLVIGAGGLGLWGVSHAADLFSQFGVKVTAVDISEDKLEVAKKYGAANGVVFGRDETAEEVIRKLTDGGKDKFDGSVDFVGMTKTADVAVKSLNKGGTVCFVGKLGGGAELAMPIGSIIMSVVKIQGVRVGTYDELVEMVKCLANRKNMPDPADLFPLDDINSIHERMRKGQMNGRAVIKYD